MRINLWAGAGAGKSTLASWLFSQLKMKDYSVELVHEYIKSWAYQKRVPKSFDQVYIFGKQLHAEDMIFQSGVEHLVTDSPLWMQIVYAKRYKLPVWDDLLEICYAWEEEHPSINILLDRSGIQYQTAGRYETLEQARQVDNEMRQFMEDHIPNFHIVKAREYEYILALVEPVLNPKVVDDGCVVS